ncbi:hypothetical protein BJY00DRAFT_111444 [Aspergillus carlsbadensis]|nr:hypothetical protein BJY00DRAFT_111444 [Aspergillus carlsbadensis]
MPLPKPHIALAGATGNLGLVILNTLLANNYTVTALTRQTSATPTSSTSKLPSHANLTIKPVDFTSVPSLTTALLSTSRKTKTTVVISALATSAIGAQNPLIDACVAAGVERFIPAEFGMDSLNPLARGLPVCAPKAATQAYLTRKCAENSSLPKGSGTGTGSGCGFSWTGIANGLFLDWCLGQGIILDLEGRSATLYNWGDVRFSVTLLRDVARAVLGVIENLDSEGIRDRVVYVHSAVVSQRQLIGYVREIDGGSGKEWRTVVKSTEEVRRESLEELGKGVDVEGAMLGFCIVGSWDLEYGCDFSGRVDNELLGVRELGEEELKGIIRGLL